MTPAGYRETFNVDLQRANTLGLRCQAERVYHVADATVLPLVWKQASQYGSPLVLGGGSNIVLPVQLNRPVIRLTMAGMSANIQGDDIFLRVEAGKNWHALVCETLQRGWYGLENLSLIPGHVGACPVQNIGAYGVEVGDRIASVQAWHVPTGQWHTIPARECRFSYRDSRFKQEAGQWVITAVTFHLSQRPDLRLGYADLKEKAGTSPTPHTIAQAVITIRQAKLPDPLQLGNAGSYFHNPVIEAQDYAALKAEHAAMPAYPQPDGRYKLAAGWLIDQLGLKGYRLGKVGVYEHQALVLVNHASQQTKPALQTTQAMLLELQAHVQKAVASRFGINLIREPIWID